VTIPGQDRTLEEGLAKTIIGGSIPIAGGSIPIATYERVSTADQRLRATILTQYEELKRRVAAAPNVSVVERYVDDGITGMLELEERPAGAKLLADAKAGKFKELWVYKLDRLGRDDIDPLLVRRELEKVGVRVYSINESVEDPLMYAITVAIAANERRTFMRRSRDGMKRTVREGRFPGGIVPFGYIVPETKEKARLVVCRPAGRVDVRAGRRGRVDAGPGCGAPQPAGRADALCKRWPPLREPAPREAQSEH
jgi:DNA invertase Pin-like site-specific DNA recombinase